MCVPVYVHVSILNFTAANVVGSGGAIVQQWSHGKHMRVRPVSVLNLMSTVYRKKHT